MSTDRLDSLETRLTSLEDKLTSLIRVFIDHSKHSIQSFDTTDKNFEVVNKKVDQLITNSSKEFKAVGGKLGEIKEELSKIQKVSNYTEEYENLLKIAK